MNIFVNVLIVAAAVILASALIPVWKLSRRLPAGKIRSWWQILTALIHFFIAGYGIYAVINWNSYLSLADLVVPAIFFCGAIFVLMVCTLSLQTALDIERLCTLEQENITDPLMGIFNRRYLDRRLKEEVMRAQRYQHSLSILLLDIDHFKKINDNYGHSTGDIVLKKLGRLITSYVRESDIVARFGGEEILVILPNTAEASASLLAERLRKAVGYSEIWPLQEEGDRAFDIRITVSIGVASFDQAAPDSRILLDLADKALYQAKKKGRDCIVIADQNGTHAFP